MDQLHYKHKDTLMTNSEWEFFKTLREIAGEDFDIYPQIHLGTVVRPRVKWTSRWYLWRIAFFFSDKYSVDFVLCTKNQNKPIYAIELDDQSHRQEKRRNRDRVVEKILSEANLHLVRFTIQESLDMDLVKSRLAIE